MSKKLTRRSFVVGVSTALGGAFVAACAPPAPTPTPQVIEKLVTVVVEKTAPPVVVKETVVLERQVTVVPPPKPSKFQEAPMLAQMVKDGKLPPVDERVPSEPLVLKPRREVGKYGGALHAHTPTRTSITPEGPLDTSRVGGGRWGEVGNNRYGIVPNVFKDWNLSKDYKELTVHLRKGMRWSDGRPFTTDDVRFWYEDVLLNKELTPSVAAKYKAGGQVMELVVDDEFTFRLRFAAPHPLILDLMTDTYYLPKHYLNQYHIKYNSNAEEDAKKEKFEHWFQMFQAHSATGLSQQDLNLPTLCAWKLESFDTAGNQVYVRNPYYWIVDTAGNQLPYVDKFYLYVPGNQDILTGKLLAGEATHAWGFTSLANYSIYRENAQKGNYTVGLYPDTRSNVYSFCFNYTHKDPVLKALFNDLRWRRAFSHAINRDEINELMYAGLGVPRQRIMDPGCSFWEEGIDKTYIKYDPDLSNKLMDELGLKWDAKHETRLRPDGKPLALTIEFISGLPELPQISELCKGYWKKIGVDLTIKPNERALHFERLQSDQHDMAVHAGDGSAESYSRTNEPIGYRPPWHWSFNAKGGFGWRLWFDTGGKEGEEPPAEVKRLWQVILDWLSEPYGTERYKQLGREMLRINADNIWDIGVLGLVPKPAIVKNTVQNAPEPGVVLAFDYHMWTPYWIEQWWIKQ